MADFDPASFYVDGAGKTFQFAPESQADIDALNQDIKAGNVRPANEGEIQARLESDKFKADNNGPLGMAKAGGLGLVRGVSAGLADYPLSAIPGYADYARKMEELHPDISFGTEIAGNVLPFLIPGVGEAAAAEKVGLAAKAARVAELTPAGLIGRAGEGIRALGEGGGLARSLLAKGVAGAVEGGLYGAGHQVSESVLDPNWTSQAALAQVGLDSLMGGGLGIGLGLATHGLERAADKLAKARDVWAELAPKLEAKGLNAIARANGMATEDVAKLSTGAHMFGDVLDSPAKREGIYAERLQAAQGLEAAGNQISRDYNAAKPQVMNALLANTPVEPARDLIRGFKGFIKDELGRIRSDSFGYTGAPVSDLEKFLIKLDRDLPTKQTFSYATEAGTPFTAANYFNEFDRAKKAIDEKFFNLYSRDPATAPAAEGLWRNVRQELKNALLNKDVWGEAATVQSKLNIAQSEFFGAKAAAASEFGNRRLAKLDDFDSLGWDAKKLNSLSTQGADLRGSERQAILDDFVAKTKNLIDAAQEQQNKLPNIRITQADHAALASKAEQSVNYARGLDEYTSLAKPSRMSAGSSGMPQTELGQSLGHMVTAGAIGHVLTGVTGIPHLAEGFGLVSQARDLLHDPVAATRILAKLAGAGDKVLEKVQGIAEKTIALEPGAQKMVGIAAKELGRKTQTDKDREADFKAKSAKVQEWAQNLPKMADNLHAGMAEHAPNTSALVVARGAQATNYLAQQLPQPQAVSPLMKPRAVSASEQSRWLSQYDAVSDPLSVLSGNPSRLQVQAVSQVHPELMDKLREQLLAVAARQTEKQLSFAARQRMGLLLAQDVDGSMRQMPQVQGMYAQATAQVQAAQRRPAQVGEMGLAKRMEDEEVK